MMSGSRAVAYLVSQYRLILQRMRGLEWLAQQVGPMLAGIRAQASSLNPAGAGLRPGGRALALVSPISVELLEGRQLLSATLIAEPSSSWSSQAQAEVNGTTYF